MSEKLILITKQDCQKCEWVKGKIPEGMEITILDADTPEGMSHLALAESMEKQAPILLIGNGGFFPETVEGSIQINNRIKDAWHNNG